MDRKIEELYKWEEIGVVDSLEEAHYLEQELMQMHIRCRLMNEEGKEIFSNDYVGEVSITVPLKYAAIAREWFDGDLTDIIGIEENEPVYREIRRMSPVAPRQVFHKRYYLLLLILALFVYFAARFLAPEF